MTEARALKANQGLIAIARLLVALRDRPMTMLELQRSGTAKQTFAYNTVGQLHRAGLIHVCAMRKVAPRNPPRPVFAFGPGPGLQGPQWALVHTFDCIAFVNVWRTLERGPMSVQALVEETGLYRRSLYNLIDYLVAQRLVRVAQWERRLGGGRPIANYAMGSAPAPRRPRALTNKERNRSWRERRDASFSRLAKLRDAAPVNSIFSIAQQANSDRIEVAA